MFRPNYRPRQAPYAAPHQRTAGSAFLGRSGGPIRNRPGQRPPAPPYPTHGDTQRARADESEAAHDAFIERLVEAHTPLPPAVMPITGCEPHRCHLPLPMFCRSGVAVAPEALLRLGLPDGFFVQDSQVGRDEYKPLEPVGNAFFVAPTDTSALIFPVRLPPRLKTFHSLILHATHGPCVLAEYGVYTVARSGDDIVVAEQPVTEPPDFDPEHSAVLDPVTKKVYHRDYTNLRLAETDVRLVEYIRQRNFQFPARQGFLLSNICADRCVVLLMRPRGADEVAVASLSDNSYKPLPGYMDYSVNVAPIFRFSQQGQLVVRKHTGDIVVLDNVGRHTGPATEAKFRLATYHNALEKAMENVQDKDAEGEVIPESIIKKKLLPPGVQARVLHMLTDREHVRDEDTVELADRDRERLLGRCPDSYDIGVTPGGIVYALTKGGEIWWVHLCSQLGLDGQPIDWRAVQPQPLTP